MNPIKGSDLLNEFGIEYFQNGSVFGALSGEVIEYLLEKGKVYSVNKGETIYQAGDKGNYFLVILSGAVSFYKFHRGEYAYIRDHLFGEELGFVAMIALHERVGKAVAKEDCHILEISCALFSQLQRDHPCNFGIMLLNLARDMARTISYSNNAIVNQQIAQRHT